MRLRALPSLPLAYLLMGLPSAAAAPAAEGPVPGALEGFPQFVEEVRAEWGIPGLAVAVVQDGRVLFAEGFGARDVGRELPVTRRTVFAIGSVTKTFTSMAVGLLVDAGRLDLDTPLYEVLGDFRLADDYATLHTNARDLLCHRTGVPGYDALWVLSPMSREEYYRRLRHLPPNAGFRDLFQYSNLMYTVAGIVVERLSGLSWEGFVRQSILEPLEMEHTGFGAADLGAEPDGSLPYSVVDGEPVATTLRELEGVAPAGAMVSNVEDLARWLLLHLNRGQAGDEPLISEDLLTEMHSPQMAIRQPVYRALAQADLYGLGWYLGHYRGRRVVNHGGNIDGFSALVSFMPDEGVGVAVLSNTLNLASYAISRNVYDRLLGLDERDWSSELLALFGSYRAALEAAARSRETTRERGPALATTQYAGTYRHPAFGGVRILEREGDLEAELPSGMRYRLEHIRSEEFSCHTSDVYLPRLEFRFLLGPGAEVEALAMPLQPGVDDIVFHRLAAQAP